MTKLRITWVKSSIGYAKDQKQTIKALGLHRLNHSVTHDNSSSIRGMINKVRHLLRIEEESS